MPFQSWWEAGFTSAGIPDGSSHLSTGTCAGSLMDGFGIPSLQAGQRNTKTVHAGTDARRADRGHKDIRAPLL